MPRVVDFERATSPFGLDQVATLCPSDFVARETTLAYSGAASLRVHIASDPGCDEPYARGIVESNAPNHLVEGDELWLGVAIYLPPGFYDAHTGYTDLIRIDSYVTDDSRSTAFADRAEINFASWDNDELHVRAARGSTSTDLIGPMSPSVLPEGAWNWVELRLRLSSSDDAAFTELEINGVSQGSSPVANLFSGAEPLNRLRFGLVSSMAGGSGDLTAYFDRITVRNAEIESGPPASESEEAPPPLSEPAEPSEPEPPAPSEPAEPDPAESPEPSEPPAPTEAAPQESAQPEPEPEPASDAGPTLDPTGPVEGEPRSDVASPPGKLSASETRRPRARDLPAAPVQEETSVIAPAPATQVKSRVAVQVSPARAGNRDRGAAAHARRACVLGRRASACARRYRHPSRRCGRHARPRSKFLGEGVKHRRELGEGIIEASVPVTHLQASNRFLDRHCVHRDSGSLRASALGPRPARRP